MLKKEITHDLDGKKLSTRWWTCSTDDAVQITGYFHDREDPRYPEYLGKVMTSITGEPKKKILAIIEWLMREEVLHKIKQKDEPEIGDFKAANVLFQWAKDKKTGGFRNA